MAYRGFGPSPIERAFWAAAKPRIPELKKECPIGEKYRVDFLVPSCDVVIELYGYRYHKTKEKLSSDAERERDLQRRGYEVIRFTGSEITKDVDRCVYDVISIIENRGHHSLSSTGLAPSEDRSSRVLAVAPVSAQGSFVEGKAIEAGASVPRGLYTSAPALSSQPKPRPRMFTHKQVAILAAMAAATLAIVVALAVVVLGSIA